MVTRKGEQFRLQFDRPSLACTRAAGTAVQLRPLAAEHCTGAATASYCATSAIHASTDCDRFSIDVLPNTSLRSLDNLNLSEQSSSWYPCLEVQNARSIRSYPLCEHWRAADSSHSQFLLAACAIGGMLQRCSSTVLTPKQCTFRLQGAAVAGNQGGRGVLDAAAILQRRRRQC